MKLLPRYWYLFLLVLVIIISQIILLEPHLKYGFSDVDWGFLSIYKTQNPYTIHQFIKNIEIGGTLGGVYTHQIYYIGIQNDIFGLNFKSFQITAHVFKILAILSVFPLFLAISGSSLVAFIATIIFGFSYSTVGTMYTVVTSSDYSAIFSMGIFTLLYWYIVKRNIGNWLILFLLFLLLILTLFLSTERMYQLPLFIALTEGFLVWQRQKLNKNTVKRLLVMFMPLILIFLAKPMIFLSYFLSHGGEIVQRISAGNWNLLLTPVIALGSIISLPEYTKFLGVPRMDNFGSFLDFLISGPLLILILVTIAFATLIFKKFYIIIFQIVVLMILFSIILYILGTHFFDHQISIGSIVQALVGFYILSLSIVSLTYWINHKDRLLIGLFIGPFLAFLYIFLTWIGAATSEVFVGVHRYLTIPALFMSLFLANLFGIIFLKLWKLPQNIKYLKILSVAPLLLLIFFINTNVKEIQYFFNYQLISGFGAADKNLMRSQLNSYLNNLSNDRPSLFYFDITEDQINGYYYDNTLLGGFASWMLWHPSINFNKDLAPKAFWNNPELLKASVQSKNGEKVIIFEKKVYNINNFYAFKLKDKKVVDIKDEILSHIGL